jgi:hypothetical protein
MVVVCGVDGREKKAMSCFVIKRIARCVDKGEKNNATSCYVECELHASSSNELKKSLSI